MKKKHEIKVRIDGVEKWVNADVWFDYMVNKNKSSMEKRKINFISNVVSYAKEKNIETDIVTRFCDYWTESNPNGKKMRFEMEKTFSIGNRIGTFVKNKREWKMNNANVSTTTDYQAEKIYEKQQNYLKKAEENACTEEERKEALGIK